MPPAGTPDGEQEKHHQDYHQHGQPLLQVPSHADRAATRLTATRRPRAGHDQGREPLNGADSAIAALCDLSARVNSSHSARAFCKAGGFRRWFVPPERPVDVRRPRRADRIHGSDRGNGARTGHVESGGAPPLRGMSPRRARRSRVQPRRASPPTCAETSPLDRPTPGHSLRRTGRIQG